ncbi:hypothetical protein SESBI_17874 [Sesbania bispinosa]|nr:hypothetical protein SESBI_17874 [Sesbania bispinosa]
MRKNSSRKDPQKKKSKKAEQDPSAEDSATCNVYDSDFEVTTENDKALEELKAANEALDAEKENLKYQNWYNIVRSRYKNVEAKVTKLNEDIEKLKEHPSNSGMDKAVVTDLVRQNHQHAHAKWK